MENGKHMWHEDRIEQSIPPTQVMLVFVITKIKSLSLPTQISLATASCLGHTFDHETLASLLTSFDFLCMFTMADSCAALSIDSGTLQKILLKAKTLNIVELSNGMYRFTHDRVQQAAQSFLAKRRGKKADFINSWILVARAGQSGSQQASILEGGIWYSLVARECLSSRFKDSSGVASTQFACSESVSFSNSIQ